MARSVLLLQPFSVAVTSTNGAFGVGSANGEEGYVPLDAQRTVERIDARYSREVRAFGGTDLHG